MANDIVEKTKKTAELYFKDVEGERPFDLWRSFDKDLPRTSHFLSPARCMHVKKYRIRRDS